MSGLVPGLQNQLVRFDSATHLDNPNFLSRKVGIIFIDKIFPRYTKILHYLQEYLSFRTLQPHAVRLLESFHDEDALDAADIVKCAYLMKYKLLVFFHASHADLHQKV